MKKLATIFALLIGLAGIAQAQTSQEYIRLIQGKGPNDGDLQLAVSEYKNANSQTTVILYGVVHVADQAYYAKVQKDLATYDSVLYEGVKNNTQVNTETKGLNTLQKLMADVLGLSFQKDGIDYKQTNFVHADIDIEQLQKNLDGQSINPLEQYVSPETLKALGPLLELASDFIRTLMGSNPEFRAGLQMHMAQQLSQTDISAALPPKMAKAIIDDRNEIVINVLKQELQNPKKKTIAVFYGAGHMPDLAKRLKKLGYAPSKTRWMTAWKIGKGASDPKDEAH